jgi:drug/metabolite transporter (DMT)-like permease
MAPTDAALAPASPSPHRAAIMGIGLMIAGIFAYSLNDAMGKWLVSVYSVPQVMLIRGVFALAVLLPFLWRERYSVRRSVERPGLQAVRAIAVVLDVACFYAAVAYLPLANVITYYLAAPIYVTALSPFLLGERVGWRRWVAVATGFVGVVIALEPAGLSLGLPELTALGGSVSFAIVTVTTRKLRDTSQTFLIATQVGAPMLAGLLVTPFVWITPSSLDFALLGLLGVVSMAAGVCVNQALKLAPASLVAPYQYTFIVWGIVFGYIFFGDIPQPHLLIGAAVIIAAGMFIFLREQMLARAERAPPVPPVGGPV